MAPAQPEKKFVSVFLRMKFSFSPTSFIFANANLNANQNVAASPTGEISVYLVTMDVCECRNGIWLY